MFHTHWTRPLPLAGLGVLMALAGTPAAALAGVPLQPHRAVYDLGLTDSAAAAGMATVRGRMVYEFTGNACEGYSISFRFVTQMADESGSTRVTDLQTSSFEEPAGKSFQFLSKTFVNQQLSEETRGRAERTPQTIAIDLKKPKEQAVTLTSTALFPTEHLVTLLERARGGETIFVADLFDGSETGEKIYGTTAVIGPRREGAGDVGRDDPAAVGAIEAGAHWPVTISYFDESKGEGGEGTPIYQLSFLLYDNGVSRRLVLDYGDFELRGNLVELTPMQAGACDK